MDPGFKTPNNRVLQVFSLKLGFPATQDLQQEVTPNTKAARTLKTAKTTQRRREPSPHNTKAARPRTYTGGNHTTPRRRVPGSRGYNNTKAARTITPARVTTKVSQKAT